MLHKIIVQLCRAVLRIEGQGSTLTKEISQKSWFIVRFFSGAAVELLGRLQLNIQDVGNAVGPLE